ncbi:Activator of 90 kDa heat shock protein ATPase-like 1 [Holothuria leucospilota]|uniref:Activator of 90 kDa heat shock protein ATPase-like 1 n=1 Tax=Holothuria leucospilota TaxID=206669 RepID=A0A9Q1CG40_HOLLE|nr:Activator of 90 kDa heat shock protein ATPase-like 1 [Holothuria leucospilota]
MRYGKRKNSVVFGGGQRSSGVTGGQTLKILLTQYLKRVEAFTRSPVSMELEPGGKFVLLGGIITGTYVKLERNKQIVQKWRFKSWPEEHYSTVTMVFEQKPDHTVLKLKQTGVPSSDFERTRQGWKDHFWNRMKVTFGLSASLF